MKIPEARDVSTSRAPSVLPVVLMVVVVCVRRRGSRSHSHDFVSRTWGYKTPKMNSISIKKNEMIRKKKKTYS